MMDLLILLSSSSLRGCNGFGTYGFDIHHRFSDPVKGILDVDELPVKGSSEYYSKMAKRDRMIRGRGLAVKEDQMLTFADGNETFRARTLGYLHYVNISLGTPSMWFLVALDTGSNLLWVPCDCKSCVTALKTPSGDRLDFNIYSPNTSSTSKKIPCNSNLCESRRCSRSSNTCPYLVQYLSNNTETSGILVEDVLHLTTEENKPEAVNANITFGCGQIQTGSFLDGAAPNGLFGLGMDKSSVPSILSSAGLAPNSFSMCFGMDGVGRINFGDRGTTDQGETPFIIDQHPTYNISVAQISVVNNQTNFGFSAVFDSGTSFTYLSDPAYTVITESFHLQAQGKRRSSDPDIPFEYCYDISASNMIPNLTLTMKGGSQFPVFDPIIFLPVVNGSAYCLAVVRSSDINIIGQNFMTGYRVVFDREKMVLGWKKSNCYDNQDSSTLPVKRPNFTVVPPATAVQPDDFNPKTEKDTGRGSRTSGAVRPSGKSSSFNTFSRTLLMLFLPVLTASVL